MAVMSMHNADHYDALERRDPAEREKSNILTLLGLIRNAKETSKYWSHRLLDLDLNTLNSRESLASIPLLTKSSLIQVQQSSPPLGGLSVAKDGAVPRRLFYSPGPIVEPEPSLSDDPWRMARALHAAGFRAGDVVANCFSYHLTPAGFMFDAAAKMLHCSIFPAGVGNVETLVKAFNRLQVTAYVGTPDFLKTILEKAEQINEPITSICKACVTGGALLPSTRDWYKERGIEVRQCYGTAELGLIAYETLDPADGLIVAEDCIVEIVQPGTATPVATGVVGEVVVTTFDAQYPLIRFATGDLSTFLAGQSSCGRTNYRLKGWMGRADQTTKVRGMFVHPEQIARVIERFGSVENIRVEVSEADGKDNMTFICESGDGDENLANQIQQVIKAECRLRAEVVFVEPQSLPNDGKVIVDMRDYS